ncbi:hypothetical protein ES705_32746 [subsurface metagenome]
MKVVKTFSKGVKEIIEGPIEQHGVITTENFGIDILMLYLIF